MENEKNVIDLRKVLRNVFAQRKRFFIMWPIVFILSCIWILPEPRYYKSSVSLAPEMSGEDVSGGGLGALASSFGINLGGAANDAIYALLYPDLFESPEFIVSLFNIRIVCDDEDLGHIDTDYYTYLTKYHKRNALKAPVQDAMKWLKNSLSSKKPEVGAGEASAINPFHLSRPDYELVKEMPHIINCSVDRKTDVTSITIKDQHPVVAALLADSVSRRLQGFITTYRTKKVHEDMLYYQHLVDSAKTVYDQSVAVYANYCDTHQEPVLQAYISERDKLENDMGLKYETYTTLLAQLTAARAKVQERKPVFTVLKSATVDSKPAGPKRMIFVAAMLLLSTFGMAAWINRRELHLTF